MDDWQQQFWKQVEATAADMEKFLIDVEEATELFVDEVSDNIGSFLEQFGLNLVEEVDNFIENLVDVAISTGDEIDAAIGEEWRDFTEDDFANNGFHPPSASSNPACVNCANYHGQVYNGNLLVCGMHPYGWDDDRCPDWEQEI